MKKNPVLLIVVFGFVLMIVLAVYAKMVASALTHAAYISTNVDIATGNAQATAVIWLLTLIPVALSLAIQGIFLFMFIGKIKSMIVAKIVKIAPLFHLELTSDAVWAMLFEKNEEM